MAMTTFLPQPGTLFHDRFLIRERVGLGPIAGVFRATDTALQKEVILKVFYPGLAGAKVRDVNLFRIFRARAFLHRNILTVQEVFSGDGFLYVTKDIVEAVSLRTLQSLKREALEPFAKKEIANLVFEMCEALKMIHLLGANGNLKPENILLSDNGLRIDDPFFLVGRGDVPPDHGVFPFADRYLAPEQLQDEMQERKESDIYALALIMGEVLVGKPVKPAVPLSDQGPFFSPELDDLYIRATASDPSARFGSVSLFWETVRQVFRLAAEEFGPGRTPSAFLPAGYQTRAKASPPPAEVFPFNPTQTVVFQAIPMPPVAAAPAAPAPAPAPVPPAEPTPLPVAAPVAEAAKVALPAVPVGEKAVDLPVVEEKSAELIVTPPASRTAEESVGTQADLLMVMDVTMPSARVSIEDQLLLEDSPMDADEEALLMAELEREAAAEAVKSISGDAFPHSMPELHHPEPEVDIAEKVAPGPHSDQIIEVESVLPPEVPSAAAAHSADAEVLREIERIIEESRELDSGVMEPELVEVPAHPVEALEIESDGTPFGDAGIEGSEVEELAEGEEELEGELMEADEELGLESSEGQTGEVEAFSDDLDEPVAARIEPKPMPRPNCVVPEKGYRRDQEFWRLRHVEEDSDLEEVMGSAGARDDEDDDLLVIGDRPAKKAEESAGFVDLSKPVETAKTDGSKQDKKGKHGKKGKKGDKSDEVVVIGAAAAQPPAPLPAAAPQPAKPSAPVKAPASQGAVVAPAAKSGSKAVWAIAAVVVIAILAGVTGLIVTQMGKVDETTDKKKTAQVEESATKKAQEAEAAKKKSEEAAAAKKKADEDKKAKEKAANAKKAEEKKKAEAKAAEEKKKADQQAAEAEKKALELKKVADELAAAKSGSLKALAPVLESAAVAQARVEKVRLAVADLQTELQPLMALEEKAREKQKPAIDALTDLISRGQAIVTASEPAQKELAGVKGNLEGAATLEAARVTAEQQEGLAKAQASVAKESAKWLVLWLERSLERKVVLLTESAAKLPAKQKELTSAKSVDGAAQVELVGKAVSARMPALATEKKANLADEAALETELTRLESLDAEIVGLTGQVVAALALTAEAPAVVETPETPPVVNVVETTPEAKKAADLSALNKSVSGQIFQLKKQYDGLKKKSEEWKKAANAAKEKENQDLAGEVDKALKALADVQKLIKSQDLDNAKVAFDALKSGNGQLMSQSQKLVAEKVAVAGATDPGTQGTQPVAGGDDKEALKSKTCPGGMKLMVVKNSDKASAAKYVAYCIDLYEFPGAGSMPKVNVSWDAANAACVAQGKRLCKKSEWQAACGGEYDAEKCNTMGADGMESSILPAGSKKSCRSPYGLYDMVGNVAEWLMEKSVAGGDAAKGAEDATCYRAAARFGASSTVGFRCCAEAK